MIVNISRRLLQCIIGTERNILSRARLPFIFSKVLTLTVMFLTSLPKQMEGKLKYGCDQKKHKQSVMFCFCPLGGSREPRFVYS